MQLNYNSKIENGVDDNFRFGYQRNIYTIMIFPRKYLNKSNIFKELLKYILDIILN